MVRLPCRQHPGCPQGLHSRRTGYFILPVDLIPDALGLLGFSDDLGVVLMITKWVSELITPEIEEQAQATYRKLTPCLHSADTHLVTHE